MTNGGWLTMIFSVGFVTGLFGFCIYKVLFGGRPDHHQLGHIEPVHEDEVDQR